MLGLVENLGLHGTVLSRREDLRRRARRDDPLHRHERGRDRRVADHVLDGELPAAPGACSGACIRRFKTPWLSLVVFAGLFSIIAILPGKTDFLGTMYSFGAMLSFTIAHASIVALRIRNRTLRCRTEPAEPARRGIDWPLFAIVGGLGTGAAWLVVVVQDSATRWAGWAGSQSGSFSTPCTGVG